MGRPSKYPTELRERAVRMVLESRADYPSEYEAIRTIAGKLGITSPESLRKWVRQAEVDGGVRVGKTSEDIAEIRELKKEVAELRRANEILKAASAFFAAELDRPPRY
jgi:transposase